MATDAFTLIKQAKTRLMFHHPFWAYFLCRREIHLNPNISTALTDGSVIEMNPNFALSMPVSEVATVLAHEVGHIALGHIQRMPKNLKAGSKQWKRYQVAADCAINSILLDTINQGSSLMSMPKDATTHEKYGFPPSLSMEEYYKLLEDREGDDGDDEGDGDGDAGGGMGVFAAPPPPQGNGHPQSGDGQGQDGNTPMQAHSVNEEENKLKEELAGALQTAKMAGKVPGGMDRYVDKAIESKVYYPEVLAAFLKESAGRSDYSWAQPNRRFATRRLYVPSLAKTKDQVTLGVIVDTSGSIDQVTLQRFAGELNAIKAELKAELHVAYVDTEVANNEYFSEDDDIDLHAKGFGGTDFKPGFRWFDENVDGLDAIIYLTDGYCSSFPSKDDVLIPTLWCIEPGGVKDFQPPFGDVLWI